MVIMGNELRAKEKVIEQFCKLNHIKKLAFVDAVKLNDFSNINDVDILVEFDEKHMPGHLGIFTMEIDLTSVLGRKVYLRKPQDLNKHYFEKFINNSQIIYEKKSNGNRRNN